MATADEVLITVRTAGVKAAGADIDRTRKKLEGLGRAARGVGKDVRRTTRDLERLTTAASELSVADALGMSSRGRGSGSGGIDDARASLARMRSDVGKTNALLRQMDLRGPKRSPFAVPEIVGSARQLQGFNRTAQRTVGAMRAVRGATTGSVGGSSAGAGRLDPPFQEPKRGGASEGSRRVDSPGRSQSRDSRQRKRRRGAGSTSRPMGIQPLSDEQRERFGISPRKDPDAPRGLDEELFYLWKTIKDPASKLLKPLTKGFDEKVNPAAARTIKNVSTALERDDLSGGDKLAAAVGALGHGAVEVGQRVSTLSPGEAAGAAGVALATAGVAKVANAGRKAVQKRLWSVARKGLIRGGHGPLISGLGVAKLGDELNEELTGTKISERLREGMTGRNKRGLLTFPGTRFGPSGGTSTGKTMSQEEWENRSPVDQAVADVLAGRNPSPNFVGYLQTLKPSIPSLQPLPAPRPRPSAEPSAVTYPPKPQATPYPGPSTPSPVRTLQPLPRSQTFPTAQPVQALQPVAQPAQRPAKKWTPKAPNLSYGAMKFFGRATGGTVGPGELTLVGEQGPEIARFPAGTQITSNRDTRAKVAGAASATRGRARDRVVRETPLNLSLDGQVFYRAVSRQTELAELRG